MKYKIISILILSIVINTVFATYSGYVPYSITQDNTIPEEDEEFFTSDSMAFIEELKQSLSDRYEINIDKYLSNEAIEESARLASMSTAEYRAQLKPGNIDFNASLEMVSKWYSENVTSYWRDNGQRTFYKCDLFCDKTKNGEPAEVGDDCTSFAYAVMALCANKSFFITNQAKLEAGSARGLTFDDKSHRLIYASCGFETIDAENTTPGSYEIWVLSAPNDGHVECVKNFNDKDECNRVPSYGWGSKKTDTKDRRWLIYKGNNEVYERRSRAESEKPKWKLKSIIRQVKKEK